MFGLLFYKFGKFFCFFFFISYLYFFLFVIAVNPSCIHSMSLMQMRFHSVFCLKPSDRMKVRKMLPTGLMWASLWNTRPRPCGILSTQTFPLLGQFQNATFLLGCFPNFLLHAKITVTKEPERLLIFQLASFPCSQFLFPLQESTLESQSNETLKNHLEI